MTIEPIGRYTSAIQWRTLRVVAVNTVRQAAATPTASVTEMARIQVNQMAAAYVVVASLDPIFPTIKVGHAVVAISPVLGTNSWGFG